MDYFKLGAMIGTFLTIAVFSTLHLALDPYKQGQVAAITGNVKYELIVNSDSTRTWERIRE